MTDPRSIQDRIIDPDPYIESVLSQVDAKVNRTIYGPDGVTPLLEPMVDDRSITYAKDGESVSLEPEEILMRAARMRRDGRSLQYIRAELDLITSGPNEVSLADLDRAITNWGMPFLLLAIKEGREPEETVTVVGYADPSVEDDTDVAPVIDRVEPAHRRSAKDLR